MIKFGIRAFNAPLDIASSERYAVGHRGVLESYGVDQIVAPDNSWFHDPNVYVIVVEDVETKRVLGGAKIQVSSPEMDLPMQKALRSKDKRIDDLVTNMRENGGTAEFCGLWNSREVAGWGIGSVFLVRAGVAKAGVAISEKLQVNSLFALCASYTLPIAAKAGFIQEKSLDDGKGFSYPNDDFKAYIALLKDIQTLEFADPEERSEILSLRSNPSQTRIERGPKGETEIHYDLRI